MILLFFSRPEGAKEKNRQEGYSVLSVSKSREAAVKKYIAGQAEHHRKEDFESELLRLPRAHGVEFDQRYVFD